MSATVPGGLAALVSEQIVADIGANGMARCVVE
jgi:hypothetical protein